MKQSTWRGEGEEEEERGRFSLLPLSLSLFHPLHRLVIFSVHWTNVVPVRSDAIIFGERDRRSRRGKKDFWPREQLFERARRGRHAGFRSIIFLSLSPRFVFFFFFPLSLLSLLPPPLSSLSSFARFSRFDRRRMSSEDRRCVEIALRASFY